MRSRKVRKFFNIGIAPSAVTSGATYGKGFTTMLPYIGYAGAGFGVYLYGLYRFNKILLRYRENKARQEVQKNSRLIYSVADKIQSKDKRISRNQAVSQAYKLLESNYLKRQHEKIQRYKVVDGDIYTRNAKDEWVHTG